MSNNRFAKYDPQHPIAVKAREMAQQFGDPNPETFARQLFAESRFNPKALSPAGARGVAQFMPATAKEYGVDVNDVDSSISGALKYRAFLRKLFASRGYEPSEANVLAGYNAGQGAFLKHKGIPPYKETRQYVSDVLGNSDHPYKASKAPVGMSAPRIYSPSKATPYKAPQAFKPDIAMNAMPSSFASFTGQAKAAILGRLYGGDTR